MIETLQERFDNDPRRHVGLEWSDDVARLTAQKAKHDVLLAMAQSGGEPDVTGRVGDTGEIIFCDCAAESPAGRRSLCYDRAAWHARKENKPSGNAVEMASMIGIELLTEAEYRGLQLLGEFDRKTSSWVRTPSTMRTLGGALFCDRRYDQVFVYHNGADSYYAARGFRGQVRV